MEIQTGVTGPLRRPNGPAKNRTLHDDPKGQTMSVPKTLKGIAEEEDSERLVFDSYLKAIKPTADAALSGVLLAQQEEHVLRCLGAALGGACACKSFRPQFPK